MNTLKKLSASPDEILRETLASLTGWTRFDCVTKLRYGKHRDYVDIERVPNYPEDLNACHELESKLTVTQWPVYVTHLCSITSDRNGEGIAFASARFRTICMILTLQMLLK